MQQEQVNIISEVWKEVEGFEGLYWISNFGKVRNHKRGIQFGWEHNKFGYRKVRLYKDGKTKDIYLHRLVALAFIDNPSNKPDVNHLDNDPSNNHVDNLEWCTHSENMQYASKQGRLKGGSKIVLNLLNGIYYDSIKDAANSINIKPNTLVYKLSGNRRNDTYLVSV